MRELIVGNALVFQHRVEKHGTTTTQGNDDRFEISGKSGRVFHLEGWLWQPPRGAAENGSDNGTFMQGAHELRAQLLRFLLLA
jgi:hypothetical protein